MLILQAHTGPLQRDGQEAGQQSLGPEHHQVLREQQERVVRAGTFSGETWKSASGPTAGRGFFSPEQVPNLGPIPGLSHGGGDEAAARARVRCVGLHRRLGRLLPDLCGKGGQAQDYLFAQSGQVCLLQDSHGKPAVQLHLAEGERRGDQGTPRCLQAGG